MATGSSGSRRTSKAEPAPPPSVLRIGHRPGRDPRLTTHLALAARAFGARRMYLHPPDPALAQRIQQVVDGWGGDFRVEPAPDWRRIVRAHAGTTVHLTMYGEPLERRLAQLQRAGELLVVVGGAKVPSELFRLARWNVAVAHQPHSEVAALAVLLAQLRGVPGPTPLPGARRRIVPRARGKRVVAVGRRRP